MNPYMNGCLASPACVAIEATNAHINAFVLTSLDLGGTCNYVNPLPLLTIVIYSKPHSPLVAINQRRKNTALGDRLSLLQGQEPEEEEECSP